MDKLLWGKLTHMRLSWSLMWRYKQNDWGGIWSYLVGLELPKTEAMQKGIDLHFELEKKPELAIEELELDPKDWEVFPEVKIERNEEGFQLVGIVDLLLRHKRKDRVILIDYKTGRISRSSLNQLKFYYYILFGDIDPEIEPNVEGYILHVDKNLNFDRLLKTYISSMDGIFMYAKFEQMYLDILKNIKEGYFEEWAKSKGLWDKSKKELIDKLLKERKR